MNTPLENLQAARELLATSWNQGHYAVDAFDETVHVDSQDACRFCAMGALYRVSGQGRKYDQKRLQTEIKALGFPDEPSVLLWNDDLRQTKAEVLRRFDEAILEVQLP